MPSSHTKYYPGHFSGLTYWYEIVISYWYQIQDLILISNRDLIYQLESHYRVEMSNWYLSAKYLLLHLVEISWSHLERPRISCIISSRVISKRDLTHISNWDLILYRLEVSYWCRLEISYQVGISNCYQGEISYWYQVEISYQQLSKPVARKSTFKTQNSCCSL